MPSFSEMLIRARKYTTGDNPSKRFREILGIVRRQDLRNGLSPEAAVSLIEELGATFVKLGQIASTHPDVLPVEYCNAFGRLRTSVNPLEFDVIKQQVERELGAPLEELFSEFDEKPVGSASIAQVHRAVLADGKTEVAVKVQRPGVVETVSEDLAIMERLVDLYDLVTRGNGQISFKELVDELVRTSKEELDFTIEAGNLDRFYRNNATREGVTSPRCYHDYSTSALLTEDFASAPCVEAIDTIEGLAEADREKLAYLTASNYMTQVMEDGFYHADPHAGNVLVTSHDGIEWIDFGMMGTLSHRERDILKELILALGKGDAYGLKRQLLKVATPKGPIDHGELLDACESIVDEFINVDLESFDTSALFNSMIDSLQKSGFDIAPFLVNLGRGLITLEGTIKLMSPKLNILNVLTEYIRKSFDLGRITGKAQKLVSQSIESAEAMATLPSRASDTLDMLQKGQVKVGMDLGVNERFTHQMRESINIFSLALIAAAVIVGSCILATVDFGPRIEGMPIVSIVGIAIGFLLAIYDFIKTRRNDK